MEKSKKIKELCLFLHNLQIILGGLTMDKVERHKELCEYLNSLYSKKNHDYGDSVHDTYVKYGLTSFLVRMEDKLNRARTLSQKEAQVVDEKMVDTLLDLANYAILAVIELEDSKDVDN